MKETTAKTKALLNYQTNPKGTFYTWGEVFVIVKWSQPPQTQESFAKTTLLMPNYSISNYILYDA